MYSTPRLERSLDKMQTRSLGAFCGFSPLNHERDGETKACIISRSRLSQRIFDSTSQNVSAPIVEKASWFGVLQVLDLPNLDDFIYCNTLNNRGKPMLRSMSYLGP